MPSTSRNLFAALYLLAFATAVGAQTYPSKPVSVVVPTSAGSSPDVLTRLVAAKLTEQLGQPVVVVNRVGASSNIGTAAVARGSTADGHALLLGSIANTVNPHIMSNVGYNFIDDLAPISTVAAAPDLLVVHPSLRATTVQELIALLKANPGTPFGHSGIGATPFLSLELFRRMTGVDVNPIPFQGGGPAQQGVLSGQPPVIFLTTIAILPRVRSGQLRALAVSSARRIAAAPDVPTVAETGLSGFDVTAWFGFFAPAKTPRPIIERLSGETRKALAAPEVSKRLIDLGAEPLGSSPEEFSAYVKSEYARWGKLAKEAGFRIE